MIHTVAQMRGESGSVRLTMYDVAFARTPDGRLSAIKLPRSNWKRWVLDEIEMQALARHKRAGLRKKAVCRKCEEALEMSTAERQRIEFWLRRSDDPVIVPPFKVRVEALAVCCSLCKTPNVVQRDFVRRVSDAQTKILSTLA